jgi:pantoate--beta-alanine ligase
MGALHEGHASLARAARAETDLVVLSLFVNPTQFGPAEDLSRYPRTFEADLAVCRREGVDVVFAPDDAEVYPPGFRTFVEVRELEDVLCGASRPGHFRGVCTVVMKLLNMVGPDVAYFGQKDAQQALILKRMVRDLDVPVTLRVCPTVREADGLALSSRNRYLSANERQQAVALSQALQAGRAVLASGRRSPAEVRRAMVERLAAVPGATLDYAEAVSALTLRPAEPLAGVVLLAVAVKFGGARLIDNLVLAVSETDVADATLDQVL